MPTERCPDDTLRLGTLVPIVVEVAEVGGAYATLNFKLLFEGVGSKFVPVIVTAVPAVPMVGLKPVTVGAVFAPTVNAEVDVAVPAGEVIEIVPVVAPLGTVTTNCVALADATVAEVPFIWTAFWLGVVLKAVPLIVTVVPTGPLVGTNPMIETCDDGLVEIDRRFPTASYA